jgi:hypothetical protein
MDFRHMQKLREWGLGLKCVKCSTKVNLHILTNLNIIKKNINSDNLIVFFI